MNERVNGNSWDVTMTFQMAICDVIIKGSHSIDNCFILYLPKFGHHHKGSHSIEICFYSTIFQSLDIIIKEVILLKFIFTLTSSQVCDAINRRRGVIDDCMFLSGFMVPDIHLFYSQWIHLTLLVFHSFVNNWNYLT